MFSDLLDMTLAYIQYVTLLLNLDPDDMPSFYEQPFKVLRYVIPDTSDDVRDSQRYNNYLRVNLPDWLPLDLRLQYVCIAVIGPLVVATFGMFFVYGKPVYIWFVCVLATLFMFLFGFILLANLNAFMVPGAQLPSRQTLSIVGGVGLPCFLLLLVAGLLGMGRARLQMLRQDAAEMDILIEEERRRRRDQRVTQQMVNREGIDLVAVAAEQVHAKRDQDAIDNIDWADVALQGIFAVVLFVGALILLNSIKIPAIADMQTSIVFTILGSVAMVVWACVAFWWVLSMIRPGRKLQSAISGFASRRVLGLVVTVCNMLYINIVTNFISILYCVSLTCPAGTRTPYAASLFPSLQADDDDSAKVISGASIGCVSCDYHAYTQRCSASWQTQLCAAEVTQRRLVYDTRVHCSDIDGFLKGSGCLIFGTYLIFLPYLQFYMAQYAVQVLKESYPLEGRYYDVFTPAEIYFQKVLSSENNAAFAYRAYKPDFRFYRLSFLLQKVVLGVVGCVMRRGLDQDVAWAGMIFFLVVPLVALSCSLYFQPFSRQVEAYYHVATQAMVSLCAAVCLAAQQSGSKGLPDAVWIVLLVLMIGVPICTLVVGNAVTLEEERRWTELWQRRLVEGVTAAYDQTTQQENPLKPQQQQQQQSLMMRGGEMDSESMATLSDSSSSSSAGTRGSSNSSGSGRHHRGPASLPIRPAQKQREEVEAERWANNSSIASNPITTTTTITTAAAATATAAPQPLALPSPLSASYSAMSTTPNAMRRRQRQRDDADRTAAPVSPPALGSRPQAERAATTATTTLSKKKQNQRDGTPTVVVSPTAGRRAQQRSESVQSADASLPEATTTTATKAAVANLRSLRALPSLLQADTWEESARLVLQLAGQTIAAPFAHLMRGGTVEADGAAQMLHATTAAGVVMAAEKAAREQSAADVPLARNDATEEEEMPRKSRGRRRPVKEKESGSSDEQGDVLAEVVVVTVPTGKPSPEATSSGGRHSGLLLSPPQQPYHLQQQRRVSLDRPIPGTRSGSIDGMPAALAAAMMAATSPTMRRRISINSSSSQPPSAARNGLPLANPLGQPLATFHQDRRLSHLLSPGSSHGSSTHRRRSSPSVGASGGVRQDGAAAVSGAAASHPTRGGLRVVAPPSMELSSSQLYPLGGTVRHGAAAAAETHAYSRDFHGRTYNSAAQATAALDAAEAAFAQEDPGEYAEEATQMFIPALYFTQRARTRWRDGEPRGQRRSSASMSFSMAEHSNNNSDSGGGGGVNQYSETQRRRQSTAASLTHELRRVRLPWRRGAKPMAHSSGAPFSSPAAAAEGNPTGVVAVLPSAPPLTGQENPMAPRHSLVSPGGSLSDLRQGCVAPVGSAAHGTSLSVRGGKEGGGVSETKPRSNRSPFRLLWRFISTVDDNAARRRKYVLSYTDVYARRELEMSRQRLAAQNGAGKDGSLANAAAATPQRWTLTPAQLRLCTHKAFWGSPTDAMLGVVEVPGSMPPWGLFCHAPPPPLPLGDDNDERWTMGGGGQARNGATTMQQQQQQQQRLPPLPMFALQQRYYAQLAEDSRRSSHSRAHHHQHQHQHQGRQASFKNKHSSTAATAAAAATAKHSGAQASTLAATQAPRSPSHPALVGGGGGESVFQFPQPTQPLLAPAYERHAALTAAYRQFFDERLGGQRHQEGEGEVLLPLDTQLDAYAQLDEEMDNALAVVLNGESAGLVGAGSAGSGGGNQQVSGTLDWLEQWGPVLTELLYEAAMDDNRKTGKTKDKEDEAYEEEGEENDDENSNNSTSRGAKAMDRSSGGGGGGGLSRSSSLDSASAESEISYTSAGGTHRLHHEERVKRSYRNQQTREDKRRLWLPWKPKGGTAAAPPTTQRDASAAARHEDSKSAQAATKSSTALSQRLPPSTTTTRAATPETVSADSTASPRIPDSRSRRGRRGFAAASSSAAPSPTGSTRVLKRQQSTLLTLITGTQATAAPSAAGSAHTIAANSDDSENSDISLPLPAHEPLDFGVPHSSQEDANRRWREMQTASRRSPAETHISSVSDLATLRGQPNTSAAADVSSPLTAAPTPAVPQDPLIQQLRCLYLVRERLKESYWGHRNQLRAVQQYIDYEINETMRRVLTFSFIVVGTVATVSLVLALLSMFHTLNWRFQSGVRKTDMDLLYELAGYESWDSFTGNCCCMAATSLSATYPYYAVDVENWVCANGITKERIRRDGYDGDVVDGYSVRALCGMEFLNGCTLTVDSAAHTATLGGCDSSAVTPAEMLRW